MAKYIIEGGNTLRGKIYISGNKNAVLPCMAAALLTEEEVTLTNVPQISDVEVMLEIFDALGVSYQKNQDSLTIQSKNISSYSLPKELTTKLRASILLVGPLLARSQQVQFYHPGGDVIGKRSIEIHLDALKKLGFEFEVEDREYKGKKVQTSDQTKEIFLEEPSVTGTENLILASVLGSSKVILKNCAKEPHIVDLCNMLSKMGAQIEGIGNSTLIIQGVEKLQGTEFRVGSDYIEMTTYAIAAALTGGEVEIENCTLADFEPVINPLEKMGIKLEQISQEVIKASCLEIKPISKLTVNIWPGFPTDLMSAFIVLATQASGVSLLHDWMYESRMFFVDKLITMGAHITICDPHRVVVYGPTKLRARDLETPDIRAGMALVLASLIAKGQSVIHKAQLIERGYEDIAGKLTTLGANIRREE